ncbi:MAG: hypothetical protein Q8S57_07270, partial [Methanoregula sp.]|nr:hypothetical protein [Methanoregula sp.]
GGVFSKVPILGFIRDSGDFGQEKTGLFGAVWIGDREVGLGLDSFWRFNQLLSWPQSSKTRF